VAAQMSASRDLECARAQHLFVILVEPAHFVDHLDAADEVAAASLAPHGEANHVTRHVTRLLVEIPE